MSQSVIWSSGEEWGHGKFKRKGGRQQFKNKSHKGEESLKTAKSFITS